MNFLLHIMSFAGNKKIIRIAGKVSCPYGIVVLLFLFNENRNLSKIFKTAYIMRYFQKTIYMWKQLFNIANQNKCGYPKQYLVLCFILRQTN